MKAEQKAADVGRAIRDRSHSTPLIVEGPLYKVRSSVRNYLQTAYESGIVNTTLRDINRALRAWESPSVINVTYGEVFDKGQPDGNFIYLRDGSRVSFNIQLRPLDVRDRTQLTPITYRFHRQFQAGSNPQFLRLDLGRPHQNPLKEPLFHAHVGTKELRIPIPTLAPLEALVFVIHAEV